MRRLNFGPRPSVAAFANWVVDGFRKLEEWSRLFNAFKGATASEGGAEGLVPKPSAGEEDEFLRGDGTWATPASTGDVSKVGTPVNNQVGVWTGDGTLEGDADLTFDTSTNTLATGIVEASTVEAGALQLSSNVLSITNSSSDCAFSNPAAGKFTFDRDVEVPDEAYGSGWNASIEVPTKNAVYDKIEALGAAAGLVLLTSGAASGATLSIPLTSYTSYRGIKIFLYGFIPATDGAELYCRFSTDGGSNYDATGYNYSNYRNTESTAVNEGSGSAAQIELAVNVGNASTEGIDIEITLMGQTSTARWSRINYHGYYISNAATPGGVVVTGGGARETAQDTDAIQFLFSTGDITSGSYVVYGLA